jgi:two-component system cell cycle response regulator
MESGADEYLTKPVQKAELIARIKSMIRLKRFQEQLSDRKQTLLQAQKDQDFKDHDLKHVPTILIVEDDEKDALLLRKQIDNGLYLVKHVTNGEEAIRLSLETSIDLILLDIMLPGINGFEVCRRIKGDDQLRNIQIVMQTSLRDLDFRIQGTDLGADDYLIKPVEPRELKARVDALLKKKEYIDKLHNNYEKAMNQAISDGLTGLYNHSHFRNFLELEIKRSKRQHHPVSLLLLDLDNFKLINDRFGHLSGDSTLIEVANIIKQKVREIDFVARYGGEEFAIILPYSHIDEARDIAERIRQAIVEETTLYRDSNSSEFVSVSIGVAFYPADGKDIESLIRKADEMMYLAKQCGKNQVCMTSDFQG